MTLDKLAEIDRIKPETKPKKLQKLSYKHKYALENLPGEIDALTDAVADIKKQLEDPALFANNPDRFHELAETLEAKQNRLLEAENEWLELECSARRLRAHKSPRDNKGGI